MPEWEVEIAKTIISTTVAAATIGIHLPNSSYVPGTLLRFFTMIISFILKHSLLH